MKNESSTSDLKNLLEIFRAFFSLLTENKDSDEDDETLSLRANILYRAMALISEKRENNLQHQPIAKAEFENWFSMLESPMKEVYQLVYAQNLFEEIEDDLLITDQGRDYEKKYWASFR
jgi:hypothetical protein